MTQHSMHIATDIADNVTESATQSATESAPKSTTGSAVNDTAAGNAWRLTMTALLVVAFASTAGDATAGNATAWGIEIADPVAVSGIDSAMPDTVEGVHYRVYRSDGTAATFADIISHSSGADAVLIGESHDDPIAHALEYAIFSGLADAVGGTRPVALSLEMFESDVQYIVDEYLNDYISESHFLRSVRPWGNYETDYRPSVEFAREHGLPVIAANAPRRYVNRVTRYGPESLSDLPESAKALLPPLPYAGPSVAYKEQWNQLMMASMAAMRAASDSASAEPGQGDGANPDKADDEGGDQRAADDTTAAPAAPPAHGTSDAMANALQSQSLWDASMAYSIAEALMRTPSTLVVHFAGSFHVETGTGIPEHLERYRPGTRRVIVAISPHADINDFDADEFAGLGDFVILTDESLPRTKR